MIQYLTVMLEHDAVPFCCYNVPPSPVRGLIPLETLAEAVKQAVRQRLPVTFLYGRTPLPESHASLIESVEHVKIVPHGLPGCTEEAVTVIEMGECLDGIGNLPESSVRNIILRVASGEIEGLENTVRQLTGRFMRLNIVIRDVRQFTPQTFGLYEAQLRRIREYLAGVYRGGIMPEVNVITDRLFLVNMNNCNAGIEHLACAPDGKLYLCPAFYYHSPGSAVCSVEDLRNYRHNILLELQKAPVCRNCDAYHCKRCIFLNQSLTLEVNTPSAQQCTASHIERNVSREFLADISGLLPESARLSPIPELDYLDPFTMLTNRSVGDEARERHVAELLSKPLENIPPGELLLQLYRIDPALLVRLKEMNCGREIQDGEA
jgi:CXXX repeat peptide maturase